MPLIRLRSTQKRKTALQYYLLIAVLLIFTILFYCQQLTAPEPHNKIKKHFSILNGSNANQVTANLKAQNLIKNQTIFKLHLKINNLENKIIAGAFFLSPSMSASDVAKTITGVANAEFSITIQEGLSVKKIDERLFEMGLSKKGEFIKATQNFNDWSQYPFLNEAKQKKLKIPLEGYIFPDTYFVNTQNFQVENLIHTTLKNFQKKTANLNLEKSLKNYDIQQIITMASIIENEVFGYNDRRLVAGIYWKRLKNNWPLGADATSLYEKNNRIIFKEDLLKESSYNTRKSIGLPSGPISNPGLESIMATINPLASDYWFYINEPKNGKTIYAKTYAEHNQNIEKYLK